MNADNRPPILKKAEKDLINRRYKYNHDSIQRVSLIYGHHNSHSQNPPTGPPPSYISPYIQRNSPALSLKKKYDEGPYNLRLPRI